MQLGVGLLQRHAGPQARGHREVISQMLRIPIELEWYPEINRRVGNKPAANDTDDKIRLPIKLDGRSNNIRIGSVASLPETVAQHRDMSTVRDVFGRSEGPPGNNWSAEQSKVIRRNMNAPCLFGMVATSDIEPCTTEVIRCDLLKNTRLFLPDIEFRYIGAGKRSLRAGVPKFYQRLRIRIGERLEQDSVDHRKDRRVHADADGD